MPTNTDNQMWRTQVVSDVVRDGLGVELIDQQDQVLAEIFRCDADQTVSLRLFQEEIPPRAIDVLMSRARERLDPFEDGTPLANAWSRLSLNRK
jgi:hypothetical protein